MPDELVTTSIQIPDSLREELRTIAQAEHRSVAGQIRLFLEEAVTRFNTAKADREASTAA